MDWLTFQTWTCGRQWMWSVYSNSKLYTKCFIPKWRAWWWSMLHFLTNSILWREGISSTSDIITNCLSTLAIELISSAAFLLKSPSNTHGSSPFDKGRPLNSPFLNYYLNRVHIKNCLSCFILNLFFKSFFNKILMKIFLIR